MDNLSQGHKDIGMTVQLGNHWPLVAVTHSKETNLQLNVKHNPPFYNPHKTPPIIDPWTDREPDFSWEKGSLIDIYT